MAKPTNIDLESQVARLSMRASRAERDRDRLYDKLRRLENAIRDTVVIGQPYNNDGLLDLLRRVPKKPRKTRTEMRKSR